MWTILKNDLNNNEMNTEQSQEFLRLKKFVLIDSVMINIYHLHYKSKLKIYF